jgi:hypothetical protein
MQESLCPKKGQAHLKKEKLMSPVDLLELSGVQRKRITASLNNSLLVNGTFEANMNRPHTIHNLFPFEGYL